MHQPFLPCALVLPETNTASGCRCWACQASKVSACWRTLSAVRRSSPFGSQPWISSMTARRRSPSARASPFPTFPSYSLPQALGHDRSGPANDRVAGCGSRPRWNITHQYIHLTLDFLRHLRKLVCKSSADTWIRIGGNTNHPRRVDRPQLPSLMATAGHRHEAIVW